MQWSGLRLEVGMYGLRLKRVQDRKGEIHEADPRDESVSPDGAVIIDFSSPQFSHHGKTV